MVEHKSWIEPLARGGYGARGVVYIIIGVFAVLAAFTASEEKGTRGALQALLDEPFGEALIYLIIVGLIGYIVWRFVQSLLDTDDHGFSAKGLAVRGGLLASGVTYTLLAIYAASLVGLFSGVGGGEGGGQRGPVASFLSGIVGSQWVALVLALVFAGVAIAHFWKAGKRKYEEHFRASQRVMRFVHPVAIIGLVARGLVFTVIALLLFWRFNQERAATDDGQETPGLTEALDFVQSLPAGQWLLGALGVGLILFALYSIAEAIWRRINVEHASTPAEQWREAKA